jgi:hypothetical protein
MPGWERESNTDIIRLKGKTAAPGRTVVSTSRETLLIEYLLLGIIAFFAPKVNGKDAGFSGSVFAAMTDVLDKGSLG